MILQVLELVPHPGMPAMAVPRVTCSLAWRDAGRWAAGFVVDTPPSALALPVPARPCRADGLWQRTCFELFLLDPATGCYLEFNFSPSGEWAAYAFDGYRAGMRPLALQEPRIASTRAPGRYALDAHLEDPDLAIGGDRRVGISAVIEEADGTLSYWALAHPPGKPDFHDPACFAVELPAAD